MRILYVGNWLRRGHFTSDEFKVARAMREEGHEVIRSGYGSGGIVVPTGRVDLVLWSKCPTVGPKDVLALRRTLDVPHVQWFWDSVWNGRFPFFWKTAPLMDVIFHQERGLFDAYRKRTPRTRWHYLDSACDPGYHVPFAEPRDRWRCPVGFIGTGYEAGGRVRLMKGLARQWTVHTWSTTPARWRTHGLPASGPVFGPDIATACASASILIGCSMKSWTEGSWSNRVYTVLASGGFYLTQHVPGLDRMFEAGVHLATYADADDCLRQVEHWLARPEARRRIAAGGCAHVRLHHTWRHRVRELIDVVKEVVRGTGKGERSADCAD